MLNYSKDNDNTLVIGGTLEIKPDAKINGLDEYVKSIVLQTLAEKEKATTTEKKVVKK